MKCRYCKGSCIKKGCYKRQQLYRCRDCLKYQRSIYQKRTITLQAVEMIRRLNNEGVGISSISRLLEISRSSVQRKLNVIENCIQKPLFTESEQEYEIDEMRTFIRNKKNECWISYAINKTTRQVIDFVVGKRTKENIRKVVDTVLTLSPKRIFTDGWNAYPGLIPKNKHIKSAHRINHIERKNLDLRTHLKCLTRKTICYSKSVKMLATKVHIYFFGKTHTVYC